MALLGYPEWAMMKNRQGEDVPKPWVTGASPVSQALLATGLGILADRPDDSGWVQEGGIDLSGIGRGGLLGLQQYVDATRNLHDSRKDFYSRLADTQNQLRANRRFQEEQRLTRIAEQEKQRMIDNFPAVLETINKTGRPEFQQSVPMLEAMFAADPGKAAAAAMNIISQIKTPPGEVKTHDIPGTDSVYITQGGIYKGTVKGTSAGGGVEKLDKKAYDGLLYNANQEPDEFTADQYFQLYSGRQQLDVKDKKFTDEKGKTTSRRYAGKLIGRQTPWEFGLKKGLTPEQMTAKGWAEDPTYWETIGTSQKPIPVTSQQSAYKIANIVGSEEQMALLEADGYDPTKRNPKTYAAYYAGRLDYNPFTGKERDYESHAITGSMSFAYLFSGATVRAEEMGQFRRTMYPMPGDSRRLVEAKRKKRQRIVDLYNSMNPDKIRLAYSLARQANGGNLPDLDMDHAQGINQNQDEVSKQQVEDTLNWDE